MSQIGSGSAVKWLVLTGIIFILMFTMVTPADNVKGQTYVAPTAITGTLYLETDMQLLFGEGGGTVSVTVSGGMSSELRRRIDSVYYLTVGSPNRNNSKVDGSLNIPSSEVATFVEIFESRLELKQHTNQYDLLSAHKNEYNGIFSGVDISREGGSKGIDVIEVEGLSDSSISSAEDIVIQLDFGGMFPDEPRKQTYSNGEIIFYSLFGYFPDTWSSINETNPNVSCSESISATIVGTGALLVKNKDAGTFSKTRIPGGDIITFKQNYQLTTSDSIGYVEYEPGNILENSIMISIYGIIISVIMLSLPRSFFKTSGREKKIQWIHWMAIGFFLAILLFFFMGISAWSVWLGAPIFTAVTGIISFKFYSKAPGLDTQSLKSADGSARGGNIKTQWHRMGLKAFERGEMDQALEYIERALKESIEDEIIWNDKGHILRKLGRNSEALKCFNVALKINPDYDIAQHNKRQTLTDLRRSR